MKKQYIVNKYVDVESAYPVDSSMKKGSVRLDKAGGESFVVEFRAGKRIVRKANVSSSKWDSERRCWID